MIVILTIKRRMHLAEATKQSLLDNGVDEDQIHIIHGFDKNDYNGMKNPHTLVARAFLQLVIPYALEKHTPIFYTECGVLFNENPFKISIEEDRINWLGYIRNMKWYIVGAKLIYFPLKIMRDIDTNHVRLAHIDRLIRNYGKEYDCLVVADKSYTYLQSYESDWGTKH